MIFKHAPKTVFAVMASRGLRRSPSTPRTPWCPRCPRPPWRPRPPRYPGTPWLPGTPRTPWRPRSPPTPKDPKDLVVSVDYKGALASSASLDAGRRPKATGRSLGILGRLLAGGYRREPRHPRSPACRWGAPGSSGSVLQGGVLRGPRRPACKVGAPGSSGSVLQGGVLRGPRVASCKVGALGSAADPLPVRRTGGQGVYVPVSKGHRFFHIGSVVCMVPHVIRRAYV